MSAAEFLASRPSPNKPETSDDFFYPLRGAAIFHEVKKKIWSSLDDWLRREGIYERVHAAVMAREGATERPGADANDRRGVGTC
jgi:hypothetical protein